MTEDRRYALLSVTDKTGVVEFAKGLVELGFTILSTGGTRRALLEGGVEAIEVADHTGFPEMMDGRVKTLHPKVHGGLLAVRDDDGHRASMQEHGIGAIDLLAVNLYRFRETVASGARFEEVVEQIDIGGPAMVRSAAKNHRSVAVVVDPDDYDGVLGSLKSSGGVLDPALGRQLGAKAFAHTAAYDAAVSNWFAEQVERDQERNGFGEHVAVAGPRRAELRYGENPHQRAGLYLDDQSTGPNLAAAEVLGGKAASYNNYLDLDAALEAVRGFDEAACCIVKHGTPCGVATGPNAARAFDAALDCDPLSAFGGIVALNRELDLGTAEAIVARETFLEAIVAPKVGEGVLQVFERKKWGQNLRVLELGGDPGPGLGRAVRSIDGGILVQDRDGVGLAEPADEVPTSRIPSDDERRAMRFAWQVAKACKSNAIVLARTDGPVCKTVGLGAGQTSRVDAVKQAVERAGDRANGAVLASDAFFPFADGLEAAMDAGVSAAIQPGGSRRDAEVLEAAEKRGVAMVLTRVRHFRH